MRDLFDLKGTSIVITGGGGHLGSSICRGLAAFGADIMIASRDGAACAELAKSIRSESGCRAESISSDITDTDSVRAMYEAAITAFGKIDVLIANAASSSMGYFDALDDAKWERGIEGTINSTARCIREVLPHMTKRGYGKIITVASMYGMVAPDPDVYRGDETINNPACYGAGKAAVIQLTKYIASYYGSKGITANSVSPGPFPSRKVQDAHPDFVAELGSKTVLGRIGVPDELIGTMIFLSSRASSYITGQNIAVDGGWTSR